MIFNLRGREFNVAGIEVRIPRSDGLTDIERQPIDKLARTLGYGSVSELAIQNGYTSAREMAYNHSFKNTRDFFLGKGWPDRLAQYDLNSKVTLSEEDLTAIDPNYVRASMTKIKREAGSLAQVNREDQRD